VQRQPHERPTTLHCGRSNRWFGILAALIALAACDAGAGSALRDDAGSVSQAITSDPMTLPVEAFGHFEPTNDVAMRQRLTIEAHAVMITTTVTIGGRSGCAMQYA